MLKLNGNTVGISTVVLAAMALGALFWRVTVVEQAQADDRKHLDCITQNQHELDFQMRTSAADVAWANDKLDAILEKVGVEKRIRRPAVAPSVLKSPADR